MTREQAVRALVALGRALLPQPVDLRAFVALGHRLLDERQRPLRRFLKVFAADPDHHRALWLGRTALERSKLTSLQRRALDLLGADPDLLGPTGDRTSELAHTMTIAWAMRSPDIGDETRRAFLRLLAAAGQPCRGARPFADPPDPAGLVVEAEHVLPGFGRVDVWMASDTHVIAVEGKLYAAEGEDQTQRYHKARLRDPLGRKDRWVVVFLTLRRDQEPEGPALSLTLAELLHAWLPIAAAGQTGAHQHLGRYLASLGRLCGVGVPGDFDSWNFTQRRRAIEFIQHREIP